MGIRVCRLFRALVFSPGWPAAVAAQGSGQAAAQADRKTITIRVLTLLCGLVIAGAAIAHAQNPAAVPAPYKIGDRVEINVDGTWYAASVATALDGRYRVHRDDHAYGVSSTEEWVTADRLRALAARPAASPKPVTGLPSAVPTGLYSCTLFGSGNTAGKLRILSGTTSSGVTPDGSGASHQFTYDAASGAITWEGGLRVFSWTVEQALYGPDAKGIPNINLHYRLRAGGNLNSMGCRRE
jgi:hypothetical protein